MNSTKVRIWRMQAMEAMADAGGGGELSHVSLGIAFTHIVTTEYKQFMITLNNDVCLVRHLCVSDVCFQLREAKRTHRL
jgi:hypothetical protein